MLAMGFCGLNMTAMCAKVKEKANFPANFQNTEMYIIDRKHDEIIAKKIHHSRIANAVIRMDDHNASLKYKSSDKNKDIIR